MSSVGVSFGVTQALQYLFIYTMCIIERCTLKNVHKLWNYFLTKSANQKASLVKNQSYWTNIAYGAEYDSLLRNPPKNAC